jgi:hypothetical protein
MKIAFIDNMNNNFFTLVRYLRDTGLDAHLLLSDYEYPHFSPESDTYDDTHRHWVHQLAWGSPRTYRATSRSLIRRDLAPFDFLVGCGAAPAYCQKAGRSLDVFLPFGGDLIFWPFYRLCRPRNWLNNYSFVFRQRQGIRKSPYFWMDYVAHPFERAVEDLRYSGTLIRRSVPMVYHRTYSREILDLHGPETALYSKFHEIRQRHEIMLFDHARHVWVDTGDARNKEEISLKGTDKLIRGFASFVRTHPNVTAAFVTFEYGRDVAASKQLIADLGIQEYVHWFPTARRKELMVGLDMADIGCGEFGPLSWFSFGALYEVLCMGKPLLHHRDDDLYGKRYPVMYPLMNVSTSEEIAEYLSDYMRRPEYYRVMGEQGRQWFLTHVVEESMRKLVELIDLAGKETKIS